MGQRQRYRLLELNRLCWRLPTGSLAELRKHFAAALGEWIAQEQLKGDPCWTEGLAVGSAGFLERIRPLILSRQETELVPKEQEVWVLQESVVPYGAKTGSKNARSGLN